MTHLLNPPLCHESLLLAINGHFHASAAFKRCVDGVQKPDEGLSLVADDKARSSEWSVHTVDYMAAKQLMDDSRHRELVLDARTHVVQECRDLHLEFQKVLGKRACHAKSWNETSLRT